MYSVCVREDEDVNLYRAQLEGYPLHIYETVVFSVACFGDRLSMGKNHLPDLGLSDFLATSMNFILWLIRQFF